MAIISGVTVDWTVSPRIITIPSPIVQVTIEDLQDTLLDIEWSEHGMTEPHLREFSGGESLGGGVSVGFTMELQNAQLAFEARTTPLESGTATSADATGTTLTDTSAAFQTNSVGRGDLVYNVADGSQATVISVTSENELVHTTLSGGTGNDWGIGDSYEVYDVVQCNISGGNMVAVDDVDADLDPVFPTFGTQIVRTSSSSATLIQSSGGGGGGTHIDIE